MSPNDDFSLINDWTSRVVLKKALCDSGTAFSANVFLKNELLKNNCPKMTFGKLF